MIKIEQKMAAKKLILSFDKNNEFEYNIEDEWQ